MSPWTKLPREICPPRTTFTRENCPLFSEKCPPFLACSSATTGSHGAGMHGPKERYVLVTAINMYNLCPMHLRAA